MSAPRQEQTILTPSQVGQYIKGFMDRDRVLSGLLVRGELSNYKMYPSGHHYFTLKDGEGALRCVMFRGDAASLRFRPQNGMQIPWIPLFALPGTISGTRTAMMQSRRLIKRLWTRCCL